MKPKNAPPRVLLSRTWISSSTLSYWNWLVLQLALHVQGTVLTPVNAHSLRLAIHCASQLNVLTTDRLNRLKSFYFGFKQSTMKIDFQARSCRWSQVNGECSIFFFFCIWQPWIAYINAPYRQPYGVTGSSALKDAARHERHVENTTHVRILQLVVLLFTGLAKMWSKLFSSSDHLMDSFSPDAHLQSLSKVIGIWSV